MTELNKLFDFTAPQAAPPAAPVQPTGTQDDPAPAWGFLGTPVDVSSTPLNTPLDHPTPPTAPVLPAPPADAPVREHVPGLPVGRGPRVGAQPQPISDKGAAYRAKLDMFARRKAFLADYESRIRQITRDKAARRIELQQELVETMNAFDKHIEELKTELNKWRAVNPEQWDAQFG